jgi:molybdopterin-guanine dinucleotide biosynthesis protein
MAIVVIGGHSRNVGKTSIVAGLIERLREFDWLAIKITQFGHGVCSVTTEPCDCALSESEHAWSIDEERDRSGESDTSRFVLAGAKRVLWARTKQGMLAEAMAALRDEFAKAENIIIESNSVMKFVRPDVYLTVLDFANSDFKASALEFLDRASAVVLHDDSSSNLPPWNNVSFKLIKGKTLFRVTPPNYVTDVMVDFVRRKIAGAKAPSLANS